jgi:hypothetical protein
MEYGTGQTNRFGPTLVRERVKRIHKTTSEMEFMNINFC